MTQQNIIDKLNINDGWDAKLWEKKYTDGTIAVSRIYLNIHGAQRGFIDNLELLNATKITRCYQGDVKKSLNI